MRAVKWCTNEVRRAVMRIAWRWFRLKFSGYSSFAQYLSLAWKQAVRQYRPAAAAPAAACSTVPGSPLSAANQARFAAHGQARQGRYVHVVLGR